MIDNESNKYNKRTKPQGRKPLRDNWPDLDDEIEAFGLANSMYELRRNQDDESRFQFTH
ncbi:MAG: hypothetical protein L0H53_12755 [Candidatus Nitrosocosmicus sp.]|nr:hypothetical protein [Candidatus Nitrosocosmicus sp.]